MRNSVRMRENTDLKTLNMDTFHAECGFPVTLYLLLTLLFMNIKLVVWNRSLTITIYKNS